MKDAHYLQAHTATSQAIKDLGYLKGQDYALAILVEQILDIASGGGWLAHSRNKPASQATVAREIKKLSELAEQMRGHVNSMHGPTYAKIQGMGIGVSEIDAICSMLIVHCRHIDLEDVPAKAPRSKTRAVEQQIAVRLADLYTSETGRGASVTWNAYTHTTSGDFVDLVEAVFRALGKKTSAASCVKYVMKHVRSAREVKEN